METNIQNLIEGALQPTTEASEPTPPKKTMSEAAIAANRANAQKSTGPRTAAGKLKSASNALQHGLYSLSNFEHFVHDNDITLEVVTNVMEQFQPITPAEHFLAHQLIHMQMRFLQMEFLYNRAMARDVKHILDKPVHFLNQILRELNSLPARIQRTIKALHSEQVRREQLAKATTEILERTHPGPATSTTAASLHRKPRSKRTQTGHLPRGPALQTLRRTDNQQISRRPRAAAGKFGGNEPNQPNC